MPVLYDDDWALVDHALDFEAAQRRRARAERIPPSALRTPALRPRTLEWLEELRQRLLGERWVWAMVDHLPAGGPPDQIEDALASAHDRREFLRKESLYLNLTPSRPLEPPPW